MNYRSDRAARTTQPQTAPPILWGGRWQHFEGYCAHQVHRCERAAQVICGRYVARLDALYGNEGTRATWALEVRH